MFIISNRENVVFLTMIGMNFFILNLDILGGSLVFWFHSMYGLGTPISEASLRGFPQNSREIRL